MLAVRNAFAASHAASVGKQYLGSGSLALRIVAPQAAQRAAFQEYSGPDAGAVMRGITHDVEHQSAGGRLLLDSCFRHPFLAMRENQPSPTHAGPRKRAFKNIVYGIVHNFDFCAATKRPVRAPSKITGGSEAHPGREARMASPPSRIASSFLVKVP